MGQNTNQVRIDDDSNALQTHGQTFPVGYRFEGAGVVSKIRDVFQFHADKGRRVECVVEVDLDLNRHLGVPHSLRADDEVSVLVADGDRPSRVRIEPKDVRAFRIVEIRDWTPDEGVASLDASA